MEMKNSSMKDQVLAFLKGLVDGRGWLFLVLICFHKYSFI